MSGYHLHCQEYLSIKPWAFSMDLRVFLYFKCLKCYGVTCVGFTLMGKCLNRWDKKGKPCCLHSQEHFSGIQEPQEWSSTVSLSLFGPMQMTAARDPFVWLRDIYNLLTCASWYASFLDRCRTPCGKVANLTNSKPVAEEIKYLECPAHGRASPWWIK